LEEVNLMMGLDHPNIMKVFSLYEDEKYFRIITEYCSGGELFEKIQSQSSFSEKEAADYMRQILSALHYLHSKGIMHRDIKAENLLFEHKGPASNLKMIDFGVSTKFGKDKKLKETLGTAYYIAPEVLLQNYDNKCDVWSCGILMYILLCGYPPFNGDDDEEILESVKRGDLEFYGTNEV
jgi:calcium-dependent protein kinase